MLCALGARQAVLSLLLRLGPHTASQAEPDLMSAFTAQLKGKPELKAVAASITACERPQTSESSGAPFSHLPVECFTGLKPLLVMFSWMWQVVKELPVGPQLLQLQEDALHSGDHQQIAASYA